MKIETIGRETIGHYDGPVIASEQDALDAMGAAYGLEIDRLAIPVALLAEDFFRLRTGLAGAVLQKFQNYGMRVALIGDISRYTAVSGPLRDFVGESNRHGSVLVVDDLAAIAVRLG